MFSHAPPIPLAPLRNMLEILKRAAGSREKVRNSRYDGPAVGAVCPAGGRSSRSQPHHARPYRSAQSRVELASVIDEALQACRPLAESAGHDINVVVPPEPRYVHADPVRLTQVFGNLLNTVPSRHPGEENHGDGETSGDDVVVTLEETGIGIQPEKLGSIFDMFVQIDGSLERSKEASALARRW